ncbi:MAG: type II secretion system protein [Opitutaceae bacterium]
MPPAPRLSPAAQRLCSRAAFTLVELLAVITVIGILVTITVGLTRGVSERSKIAQAKADLAVLAAALEQYKLQYGDYPWVEKAGYGEPYDENFTNQKILFQALIGRAGPKDPFPAGEEKRSFVQLSRFHLRIEDPDAPEYLTNNYFAGPWDRESDGVPYPYSYYYKKIGPETIWEAPSFLLFSHGPDGRCIYDANLAKGFVTHGVAENADNLYAGRDT